MTLISHARTYYSDTSVYIVISNLGFDDGGKCHSLKPFHRLGVLAET